MLRKLLDSGARAARPLALAVLLAGACGALAQGVTSTEPVPAPTETAAQPTAPLAAEATPEKRDLSEWALAAAVLGLVGVVYLIVHNYRHQSQPALRTAGIDMSPVPTKQFGNEQTRQIEAIVRRVLKEESLVATPKPAQNQPKPAANQPMIKTASTALPPPEVLAPGPPAVPVAPAATEAAAPEAPTVAVPLPAGPRRAYVSSAPVNGRFRRNVLQDQPAHNSIYELTRDAAQPDQATFQVNPDPASHPRHISSYADVLEPACEFNLPQGAASRIITEAPGLLRRVDGDDWEIVRKARIHFA